MFSVSFRYDGAAEPRLFHNVISLETGTYQHPNGEGTEAVIEQLYEGDVERFPIRGYDTIKVHADEFQIRKERR